MTPREIIYDVRHILQRLGNESSLPDLWILEKINKYREIHLMNYKLQNNHYPEQSYQYFPAVLGSLVDFQNMLPLDPAVEHENGLMKYWLPDYLEISGIWTTSGLGQLNLATRDLIRLRIENGTELSVNDMFYWIENNHLMLYDHTGAYRDRVNIRLIASNPMQVDVVRNSLIKSGTLKSGDKVVIAGAETPSAVEYNGEIKLEGQTIEVMPSYNGLNLTKTPIERNYIPIKDSYLLYEDPLVQRSLDDPYPETRSIIQTAILEFITRDMNIEYKMIEETISNGRDDLKVLNTEANR